MKKWILAVVLLPLAALNASAGPFCTGLEQKAKDGIYYKYRIKAINVLDYNDQIEQVISFRVGLTDTFVDCLPNDARDFDIGGGTFLKLIFPTKTLSARSDQSVLLRHTEVFGEFLYASPSLHQSAMAWMIQSAGFDTFQSEQTNSLVPLDLTPQHMGNGWRIHISQIEEERYYHSGKLELLGTATIGTNTYEVFWTGTKAYLNP